MMRRTAIPSFLSAGISVLFLSALGFFQNKAWEGKIEFKDGIKIVKNPGEPVHGETVLDLAEDLTIGGEDDDNSYFYKEIEIAVAREGTIYVLDTAESTIKKFDTNGRFVLSFGRKGLGPGEFGDFAGDLFIDLRGRVCVTDDYRIHVFDSEGRLDDAITLTARPSTPSLTMGGGVICKIRTRGREIIGEEISLFDQTGKMTSSFFSHSYPLFRIGNILSSPSSHYNPGLFLAAWSGGSAIFGFSKDYRLNCLDGQGRTSMLIEKDEPPTPMTEAEKRMYYRQRYESSQTPHPRLPSRQSLSMDDIMKLHPLPDEYPYFMGIYSDDEANIYALRTAPLDLKKWTFYEFDVFDSDGRYASRIKMKPLPAVIKGGVVYEIRWDDSKELYLIKRHKVLNWSRLGIG